MDRHSIPPQKRTLRVHSRIQELPKMARSGRMMAPVIAINGILPHLKPGTPKSLYGITKFITHTCFARDSDLLSRAYH